jgi:outer membrane protein OmpA-like peptidoglycan-associated protein
MKFLGWILFLVVLGAGIVLYNTSYLPLRGRLDQQVRETEMWIGKTEQLRQQSVLEQTRQRMTPDVSLLLADVFPSMDSFGLTRLGRDTLMSLANELRRTRGRIVLSVFTDDSGAGLHTKARYPDAFSFAAAKGAVVARFLLGQGVPASRLVLLTQGVGAESRGALPDLKQLSSRRLEIAVRATLP